MRTDILHSVIRGALAGIVATVPMSGVMLILDRRRSGGDPTPLPPRQITIEATELLGVRHKLGESAQRVLTTASHFGYGAVMGALFGAFCGEKRSHAVTSGASYGLAVWVGSYLCWLPALHSRAAAPRQSLRRNAVMIAAHIVWGASLAYLARRSQTTAQAMGHFTPARRIGEVDHSDIAH
jgi:uncharacterized membrane protein YagU involved in acid resistance